MLLLIFREKEVLEALIFCSEKEHWIFSSFLLSVCLAEVWCVLLTKTEAGYRPGSTMIPRASQIGRSGPAPLKVWRDHNGQKFASETAFAHAYRFSLRETSFFPICSRFRMFEVHRGRVKNWKLAWVTLMVQFLDKKTHKRHKNIAKL